MTINKAEDIPNILSFRDAELPWKERMDSVTSVVFGEHVSECSGFPFEKHPNLTSATFLNPVCGEYIENYHGKIVGYSCSYAETYAREHELEFEDLGIYLGTFYQIFGYTRNPAKLSRGQTGSLSTYERGEILCAGADIGSVEYVVENADTLPLTLTLTPRPSLKWARSDVSFTVPDCVFAVRKDAPAGIYTAVIACTKIADTEGNDLMPYAKNDLRQHRTELVVQMRSQIFR